MNDMERRKFEDSFQEAFKDAEVSPSDNVWTNVELDLERVEGGKMKRRLVFFKMLAAASVTFAVLMAGVGYYLLNDQTQSNNLAQEATAKKESKELTTIEELAVDNKKSEKTQTENLTNSNSEISEQLLADQKEKSATGEKTEAGQEVDDVNSKNTNLEKAPGKQELKLSSEEKLTKTNNVDNNQKIPDHQPINAFTKSKNSSAVLENKDGVIRNSVSNAPSIDQERIELDSKIVAEKHRARTMITESSEGTPAAGNNNPSLIDPVAPTNSISESSKLPLFYQPKSPELQLPSTKADPGVLLLAKLADQERSYIIEDKKKQKDKSEKLWTSVGFAAGGFNSPNPSVSPPAYSSLNATSNNVAAQQSKASGLAYSVGVSVGANLSDRWVLQGGVNYLTQSSDYTANNVIVSDNTSMGLQAESINAYNDQKLTDGSSLSRVAQTFPYNVNNNVQFVSVPLQAGYLVVNKKFGFQVNAGISTDLFLQNTITPDGGGLTKTTQGRGDDSPYRSLNFSGLMGTELSYKIGYRYRLSLNPGLRYPLNSVYKSETGVQATPFTFDVGLRFRYIFH